MEKLTSLQQMDNIKRNALVFLLFWVEVVSSMRSLQQQQQQFPLEKARAAVQFSTNNFESVIDYDDRLLVHSTLQYPYSAIGRLQIDCRGEGAGQQPQHPLVCTGALIGPRTVLTAAHCIGQNTPICQNISFAPGQMGEIMPFGKSKVQQANIPPEWFLLQNERDSQRYDFAVLTLVDPLGLDAGWFAYGADCGTTEHEFKIAGYPADLDRMRRSQMYWVECSEVELDACVRDREPGMFNHKCDTYKGMSGAPLWVEYDGMHEIRGIHTKGKDPNQRINANFGVYISPEAFDYITIILP